MQMISCCWTPQIELTQEEVLLVDKSLGNIKKSQKSITFCGLIHVEKQKASVLHYQASP